MCLFQESIFRSCCCCIHSWRFFISFFHFSFVSFKRSFSSFTYWLRFHYIKPCLIAAIYYKHHIECFCFYFSLFSSVSHFVVPRDENEYTHSNLRALTLSLCLAFAYFAFSVRILWLKWVIVFLAFESKSHQIENFSWFFFLFCFRNYVEIPV